MSPILVFVVIALSNAVIAVSTYDNRKPLFLTPYLKEGKVKEAQEVSKVFINGFTSYTGFFTMNETCKNHLFFWFNPAEINWDNADVFIWLNGGPGASSLFGLFVENGPYNYFKKTGLVNNSVYWSKEFNMVYVDQPVGTGFSFSENNCLHSDLDYVSNDMYSLLTQFFQLFPNLVKNNFYLSGESFAGHFLTSLGEIIDRRNEETSSNKINLKGIFLGNAFLDIPCYDSSDYAYELGIVDDRERSVVKELFKQLRQAETDKKYSEASDLWYKASLILEKDLPSAYNILYDPDTTKENEEYQLFLRGFKVRKLVHVGNAIYRFINYAVYDAFSEAFAKNITPSLNYLLAKGKYTVAFYTGQLDMVCPISSVTCSLSSTQWPGVSDYLNSTRYPWYLNGNLAGWYNEAHKLYHVIMRNCGHLCPADQPEAVFSLIKRILSDTLVNSS